MSLVLFVLTVTASLWNRMAYVVLACLKAKVCARCNKQEHYSKGLCVNCYQNKVYHDRKSAYAPAYVGEAEESKRWTGDASSKIGLRKDLTILWLCFIIGSWGRGGRPVRYNQARRD